MGRKCRVKDCLSDSRRPEDLGVTFHKVPFHGDIRPKWLSLCKIQLENNQLNKIIYVCSRHFRRNDFCTFKGTKYMLKQGVLPSMFPWTDPSDTKTTSKSKSGGQVEIKKEIESESDTEPKDTESNEEVETMKPRKTTKAPAEKRSSRSRPDKDAKVDVRVKLEKIKIEPPSADEDEGTVKEEDLEQSDLKDSSFNEDFIPVTEFTLGSKVEVTDFSGAWLPAKISEVDYTENEVFIEFDESTGKSSEWIPMDSKRLRQLVERTLFEPGEKVMATWRNSIKFPATIIQAIDSENYEVLFEDNIQIVLKASKISKAQPYKKKTVCSAKIPTNLPTPLFAPVEGSKQDRRARKRKLNVAELFNKKRPKSEEEAEPKPPTKEKSNEAQVKKENDKDQSSSQSPKRQPSQAESGRVSPISGDWICRWTNGTPVGVPSVLDSRKSVIVNDPKLPEGWKKHFVCRSQGTSAGKWDSIIISPEGKKFRSKSDLQTYIEKEKLNLSIDLFDFSLHLKKARALGLFEKSSTPPRKSVTPKPSTSRGSSSTSRQSGTPKIKSGTPKSETPKQEETVEKKTETKPAPEPEPTPMKIIFENGVYQCPIEGCAKNFRKENLAQMHVKHYHPQFSKLVGSTPNVADLAYARTVGDAIEDFLPKTRLNQCLLTPTSDKKTEIKTTRTPTSKTDTAKSAELKSNEESVPSPKTKKDSEIVKILTSETKTPKSQEILKMESKLVKISTPKTDSKRVNFTSDVKKEIKSPEAKPTKFPDFIKKDDVKPPGSIKTLLPVVRTSIDEQKSSTNDSLTSTSDIPKSSTPLKSFSRQLKTNRRRNNSDYSDSHKRRRYTKHDYDYYTDIRDSDSKSPDYLPSRKKKSVEFNDYSPQIYDQSTSQSNNSQNIITENGEMIKIVTMKQEEIINCTCGFMEEDGLMIQCELCLCWQHAYCNNIEREDQVPEKYICYICQNPLRMRASKKYVHDQDWLKHGILPSTKFHAKDEKVLYNRFENLRISHELSGNLRELSSVLHSLRVKLKIAENKDHPKFYLWSKPWPKTPIDNNIKEILENYPSKPVEPTVDSLALAPQTNTDIESSLNKLLHSDESEDNEFKLTTEMPKPEQHPSQSEQELLNILQGDETNEKPTEILNTPQEFLTTPSMSTTVEPAKESDGKTETKAWIDGEVMSGEVSDGEMISQALASEALASDLLSSPTTALNLTLTQSDIEKIQKTIDNSGAHLVSCNPCIPEPEDKIESAECRENLIDNISYYQKMVDSRMDAIEQYVLALEKEYQLNCEDEASTGKIKETLVMVNRDLTKVRKMASLY